MTDDQSTSKKSPEEPAADISFGTSVLQFFLIPAFVVFACVGLFLFFGWLVAEDKSSLDHLRDIKSGSATRRWQAAFELAKQLNNIDRQDRADIDRLVPEMVDTFQEAERDDPRVRRYLALAMGHVGDQRVVPVLVEALTDDDPETRIYSIWALGSLGDERAVEPLLELVQHDDPGIRKMAVYSLGTLGAEEARPKLQAALGDYQMDVAWNAAIALAKLGDDSGQDRIYQMLDRQFLDSVADMTEEQRGQAMMNAMKGAVLLRDPAFLPSLEEISRQDPNLKVRQAAFEAIDQLDKLLEK